VKIRNIITIICVGIIFNGYAQDDFIVPLGLGLKFSLAQEMEDPRVQATEVSPYIQLHVIKYGKVQFAYFRSSEEFYLVDEFVEREHSRIEWNVIVNLNWIIRNPYVILSWRSHRIHDDSPVGDVSWKEFGGGFGGSWRPSAMTELYVEGLYIHNSSKFEYGAEKWGAISHMRVSLGLTAFFY
jgi:hypothetical protein